MCLMKIFRTSNQAVSLRSFALFRSAAPVPRLRRVHSAVRSSALCQPAQKIGQAATSLPPPHLHTRSPCVRRGYCSHNTASFISLSLACLLHPAKGEFAGTPRYSSIHSSSIRVCRPLFIGRLLFRPAIGLGSRPFKLLTSSHFQLTIINLFIDN